MKTVNSVFSESLIPEVRPATTPVEMRRELLRLRREDPIVRSVMDAADYGGWSAEDRYVMLSYHAIKAKNEALVRLLDMTNCTPTKWVIPKESGGA